MVCHQCGKTGHTRPNCPEAFDVHTMTVEEHSNFVQHELAALDVCTTDTDRSEGIEEVAQGETTVESGFMSHNE